MRIKLKIWLYMVVDIFLHITVIIFWMIGANDWTIWHKGRCHLIINHGTIDITRGFRKSTGIEKCWLKISNLLLPLYKNIYWTICALPYVMFINRICLHTRSCWLANDEGENPNKGPRETVHHWYQSNHLEMSGPKRICPSHFHPNNSLRTLLAIYFLCARSWEYLVVH